jgi:hypothetical protein
VGAVPCPQDVCKPQDSTNTTTVPDGGTCANGHEACMLAVCLTDPFCCHVAWDAYCVKTAQGATGCNCPAPL